MNPVECIDDPYNAAQPQDGTNGDKLPEKDIFLNPAKAEWRKAIVQQSQNMSSRYFTKSRIDSVFPELFSLLWHSSLPCGPNSPAAEESLLRSCQFAGQTVPCSDLFTKVPTDSGLCCALNTKKVLRQSFYSDLVQEMQKSESLSGHREEELPGSVGLHNGLKIVLDLHSDKRSAGTNRENFAAFREIRQYNDTYYIMNK